MTNPMTSNHLQKVTLDPTTTITNETFVVTKMEDNHVHGPNCNHEHDLSHYSDKDLELLKAIKYLNEMPKLDIQKTFETNDGPNWNPNPWKICEHIQREVARRAGDTIHVVFVNALVYQFLVDCPPFRKQLKPSKVAQFTESGVLGILGSRCLVMTDAGLEPDARKSLPKAYYFCSIVEAEKPAEVLPEYTADTPGPDALPG